MILLLALVALQEPNPVEIIRQAVEAGERNWKMARNYAFVEREEERELSSDGSRKKTESHTYDVTILEGEPYYRLIQKDDQPLPPKDEKKEQEKLDKSIREREKETPAERQKRLAKYEKNREEGRKFLREVTEAYDFKIEGEESIAGRPAWVIAATPRPGFKPTLRDAHILPKLRGKLWIDKEEYQWAKAEIEVIDTISFGLALIRIHKGSDLKFEAVRVNDEVWLPKRSFVRGSARLAYFKHLIGEDETTYRDYKKFQVESKIITGGEVP